MPISTLCTKSMPSTASRKPCTKCWRDCSPSVTISRPASSCAFNHNNVASRLAAASSSPPAFHCGHSLFVSASQNGLGRLPAIVALNMSPPPGSSAVFQQREELTPQACVGQESAAHDAVDHFRFHVLYAAPLHAVVIGFHHDRQAVGLQLLMQKVRDLRDRLFLDLRPRHDPDHKPRVLGKTDQVGI